MVWSGTLLCQNLKYETMPGSRCVCPPPARRGINVGGTASVTLGFFCLFRMHRLLSYFIKRPTTPPSRSLFSTTRPQLALALQPNMSQARHPPPSSVVQEKFGNFDLIKRVKLGFSDITASSWCSRVTGLKVVHLDYEGEPPRDCRLHLLCASCLLCEQPPS
jgi:hypothetical protein